MTDGAPLYSAHGALVTRNQFSADGTAVALAHVANAKLERGRGMGWAVVLFLLSGVLMLASAPNGAGLLMAAAAAQAVRIVLQWRLVLALTNGQEVTIVTYNRTHAQALYGAVSQALSSR